MKKLTSIALRTLVSGVLLWLLFRQHSLADGIWPHLRTMQHEWHWVLAGIGCVAFSIVLNAWRWWLVLRPHVPEVTLRFTLRTMVVAGFFNISSVGAIGGDAWRVIAVRHRYKGKGAAGAVSVMIDHFAGLLGMAMLFTGVGYLALYQWPDHADSVRSIIRQFTIVLFVAALGMFFAVFSLSPWFHKRTSHFVPKRLEGYVARMSAQFSSIWSSWRAFLAAALVSVVMMSSLFFAFYCGLRAVGGQGKALPVMLAMPVVDMAAALPISVSGLGVREKTFETLMQVFTGMAGELSVSASLAGWLFTVICGLIGGLVFVLGRDTTADEESE